MIKSSSRPFKLRALIFSFGSAALGIAVVWSSFASIAPLSFEPENGTISGPAAIVTSAGLSGGSAIKFGAPATSGPLPFTLPSQATLKASSKKVFAHYFTPYPISFDNKPASSDYYTVNYLNPAGENNKFLAIGGLLRERPLPRPVSTSTSWALEDMKTEVRHATEAGLDGFTIDVLGTSGSNWDRLKLLLQAAPLVDPNFKIMLMPDSNGSNISAGPASYAAAMAGLEATYKSSLFHLPDGRLVISPFYPENSATGVKYWTDFIAAMKNTHGITVAFVPCFLNYTANASAFAPISYGFSNWGDRSPASNQNLAANIADAHTRGRIWMQPVSLQDARPNASRYWEANNTENLRLTWTGAIGGADWVQIPTWNDYSENAQISPSTHIGWSPLDISSYYLTRFKSTAYPAITKDVLYLSHRIQPYAAIPTGGQTSLMVRANGSPSRDTVEILSFLTQPAAVTVKIGTNVYTYNAPAGVFSQTYPLAIGTVSATATRSGSPAVSATSPFPVVARQLVQDLNYYFTSSAR